MIADNLARYSFLFVAAISGGLGIFVIWAGLHATGLELQALVPLGIAAGSAIAGGAR